MEQYLRANGITFTNEGLPIIPKEMILDELPIDFEVIPFTHINYASNPNKTIVCSFTDDKNIEKVLKKIDEYIIKFKKFYAISGFDFSIRIGYDVESQRFNNLINQMLNCYCALNGIKILLNFRTGSVSMMKDFNIYPDRSIYIVGTLGCARGNVEMNSVYESIKLQYFRPKELVIYGTLKNKYKEILNNSGIKYIVKQDYQNFCRKEKSNGRKN